MTKFIINNNTTTTTTITTIINICHHTPNIVCDHIGPLVT